MKKLSNDQTMLFERTAKQSSQSFEKNIELNSFSPALQDMDWLEEIINLRVVDKANGLRNSEDIPSAPELDKGHYSDIVKSLKLSDFDRLLLITSFCIQFAPELFEPLVENETESRFNALTGGEISVKRRKFIPNYATVLFLASGNNYRLRNKYTVLLENNKLIEEQIICYRSFSHDSELDLDSRIELDQEYKNYILQGEKPRLDHGKNFPAKLLKVKGSLKDLIIKKSLAQDFKPLFDHAEALKKGFNEKIDHKFINSCPILFYGPPGTGKTYTVSILGNEFNMDVYRVDLSMVISKYVGETEKNLDILFKRLSGKNCILFFDEADALFGKRTEVKDSNDAFMNQQISFLLQRMVEFDGISILCTNLDQNMDEAFTRRFVAKINFIRPDIKERKALWKLYTPEQYQFKTENLIDYLSQNYTFAGAQIKNVMMGASKAIFNKGKKIIDFEDLNHFLKVECEKEFGQNYKIVNYQNIN